MAPPIPTARLELVALVPELIAAILDGTAGSAGLLVPDGWPDEHDAGFLRMRQTKMLADPRLAQWVRGVVLAGDGPLRTLAGHAGFHGPPGMNGSGVAGALEVGYTIFPAYRGRGYATEAVAALIDWAGREHGVSASSRRWRPTMLRRSRLSRGSASATSASSGTTRTGSSWCTSAAAPAATPEGASRAGRYSPAAPDTKSATAAI